MVVRLKEILVLFVLVFFIGCGSKKKLVESTNQNNKKEVVTVKNNSAVDGKAKRNNTETRGQQNESVNRPENKEVFKTTETSSKAVETVNVTKTKITDYTQQYIDRYASIAVTEMHRYKIPASITLAQGVLESGSGRSPLALKSNNHFGIKCHKGWKGNSVSHDDDAKGECFRKYTHPETSYEDHSKFLTGRSRYAKLFKLKLTDYIGWAYGLKKAGYATDKKYPKKLITIIKKYHLYNYDTKAMEDIPSVVSHNEMDSIASVTTTHEVVKGDTLYSISRRYQTTVEKLKEVNGLRDNIISIGQELLIP